MFPTFPDGWSGAGLLLLRAAACVVLMVQGLGYFAESHEFRLLILSFALIAGSVLLVFGFLTRFAAAIAAAASFISLVSGSLVSGSGFDTKAAVGLTLVITLAVLCLGPGAYSIDARIFGRREVIIPSGS